jgi:hypothetical protein
MKKLRAFEWHRQFKEDRDDVRDDTRKGQPKNIKGSYKCGQGMNLGTLRLEIRCETNSRRNEYRNLFRGKDPSPGLKIGFSTMKIALCMMCNGTRPWGLLSL